MASKVLIVERHASLRSALMDAFLQAGGAVQVTRDVETAGALLAAWQPDLVILDMSALVPAQVHGVVRSLRGQAPAASFVVWAWGVPPASAPALDALIVWSPPDDIDALVDRARGLLHEAEARAMN